MKPADAPLIFHGKQLTVKPVSDPSAQNGGYLRLKNIIGSWKVSKKNVFPDEDYDDLCMTIRTVFKQDKAQSYHEAMLKGSLGKLMQQKADIEKVIRNSNDKSEISFSKSKLGIINLFIHVRERAMSEIDTYLYWIDCVPLQDISSLNKLLNKPR